MQSVGNFLIGYMSDLSSFDGLDNLTSITNILVIRGCWNIVNLNGLETLNPLEGFNNGLVIVENTSLNDCSGLDCYFFSEEFRDGRLSYQVQPSLYPSILENCGIDLSNDDFTYKDIRIYPNPAETTIHIDSDQQIHQIDIFDLFGRLVKHKISDFESFDLSNLSSGGYIMQIHLASNLVLNHKLVIR
ncbi:MAG: T9SS type A sorting domain-containing protein [Aequorivita sp.]